MQHCKLEREFRALMMFSMPWTLQSTSSEYLKPKILNPTC